MVHGGGCRVLESAPAYSFSSARLSNLHIKSNEMVVGGKFRDGKGFCIVI